MRGRTPVPRRPGRRARPVRPLHAEVLEERQLLATFTVLNASDTGAGSLRQAILSANASPGLDLINFNIAVAGGAPTIAVQSALPPVTDALMLDGTSQPGSNRVEINGATVTGADGLVLSVDPVNNRNASGSVIRGLAINGFGGSGIVVAVNSTTIQGNSIGTDRTGTQRRANGGSGIFVLGGVSNTIGGTTAAARNVIAGNAGPGISVVDSAASAARFNVIQGNFIGTNAAGNGALGNQGDGISLSGGGQNLIGGTIPGAGNVIAGNGGNGIGLAVLITGTSPVVPIGNVIQGNLIGTDALGLQPLGNFLAGIADRGGLGTVIGGADAGALNRIAANGGGGISLSGGARSARVQGNLIVGNAGFGVRIDADATTITGN
ncbi:MAG TPA: hypothetical protein VF590_14300, partial [Isosphaeraceae bacterium]